MTISANTSWQDGLTVPYETWQRVITAAGGPAELSSRAAYQAASNLSGLALAMLGEESSYGTRFNRNVAANHNPLNLRPPAGNGYEAYFAWPDGIGAYRHRLTDPAYKSGIYQRATTIRDLITVYAPPSDDNDTNGYIEDLVARLNAWGATVTTQEASMAGTYPVAGLSAPITLPVPLIQSIIPVGQTNQRPGIDRELPGYWVQHETANTARGADAEMHARYLQNGANGGPVSWHFSVDDHQIYQHIPIDEVTWQAADGSGPGNMSGVSCEMCVNADGDETTARHNTEALCAEICKALGLGIDRVKAHYDFNAGTADRHHCPDHMLNAGYWPTTFKANVAKLLLSTPPVPAQPVPTVPWDRAATGIQDLHGTKALAFLGESTAKRNVPVRVAADSKSKIIGTIGIGHKATVRGSVRTKTNRWIFIDLGEKGVGRALWSAFVERWPTL